MIKLLLAGILILLPHIAQAESLTCAHAEESEPSLAADPFEAEHHADPHPFFEPGLYPNPYSPASPTNFEALIGPYLYVQGQRDRVLYDARSNNLLDVYDHGYGPPLRQSEVSHRALGKPPGSTTTIR